MATTYQGGCWDAFEHAGVVYRDTDESPTVASDSVAPVCRHPKLIIYYTDSHNVDEDLRSISQGGGAWPHETNTGIMHRAMELIVDTWGDVASVQKKINRTYSPFGDACSIDEDR